MQYVFPVITFSVLLFLVLLRIDIYKLNRLRKRSQSKCDDFLNFVDTVFVHIGGDLSELAYRSRLLFDCARLSSEKIGAIHIILGSAMSAASASDDDYEIDMEKIRSAADTAIASLKMLELFREKTSRRWRRILARGEKLSTEDIERAKEKLLAEFANKYNYHF